MLSYNEKCYNRLKALCGKISICANEKSRANAEIKALSNGCALVRASFDAVKNELWLDSMDRYGKAMMCLLFGEQSFELENMTKNMQSVYKEYAYDDMKNEYDKYISHASLKIDKFVMTVCNANLLSADELTSLFRFTDKYVCPGVILTASGAQYDFDDYDAFDLTADEWSKIGACTFNFTDSLGGNK